MTEPCERLPFPVHICPVCGNGIKFSRGFTWIAPSELFDSQAKPECFLSEGREPVFDLRFIEHHHSLCPMCAPPSGQHGLMWVGRKFYTPQEFVAEAASLGISKRISNIPRDFKFGETYIFFAHLDAVPPSVRGKEWDKIGEDETKATPGVFYVTRPSHVEIVVGDEIPEWAVNLVETHGEDVVRLVRLERLKQGQLL